MGDVMNPLTVFPFKNMQAIVDLVASAPAKVRAIQNATGMCFFDSTEVTDMLAHLTSFGCVKQTDQGWILEKAQKKSEYGKFRDRFLTDTKALYKSLGTNPKTVAGLVEETKLSEDLIQNYLSFLAEITKHGVISRKSGTITPVWSLVSD